ncbi:MAG: helix-turn-helix domain-containing protein [Nitrosomonadales bacterium]
MQENSNSIQVIDRLSRLLDVIAGHEDAVNLKIISAETGLHPSTLFVSSHHSPNTVS